MGGYRKNERPAHNTRPASLSFPHATRPPPRRPVAATFCREGHFRRLTPTPPRPCYSTMPPQTAAGAPTARPRLLPDLVSPPRHLRRPLEPPPPHRFQLRLRTNSSQLSKRRCPYGCRGLVASYEGGLVARSALLLVTRPPRPSRSTISFSGVDGTSATIFGGETAFQAPTEVLHRCFHLSVAAI